MSSKARISRVTPIAGRRALRVEWANGREDTVNLTAFIREHAVLAPLANPATFKRARVGEWGFDVSWGGDLEIAATTLYRLALEQAGEVMPTREFRKWMTRNKLTLTTAAQELGFTRRTVTAYSSGAAMIPKVVELACEGWEHRHRSGAA